MPEPLKTPEMLSGIRIRQKTPDGAQSATHMHVVIVVDVKTRREVEVFAQVGKSGGLPASSLEATCRMVSLFLRIGGSLEAVTNGEVFRHFQVMSNELSDPRILVCPTDTRRPAASFRSGFSNTNLSYFVGVDADEILPQMLLSGDRNLTNAAPLSNGILFVTSNTPAWWTAGLHKKEGNVVLADGSIQSWSTLELMKFSQLGGTNRLALP